MKKIVSILLIAVVALLADGVIVIVNNGNAETEIKQSTLKSYYRGQQTMWKDNNKIVPCHPKGDTPQAKAFYSEIMETTKDKFDRYWTKKLFSGSGTPPMVFMVDEQIVKIVSQVPGGIGIISADYAGELTGVKKLTIKK